MNLLCLQSESLKGQPKDISKERYNYGPTNLVPRTFCLLRYWTSRRRQRKMNTPENDTKGPEDMVGQSRKL